MKVNDRDFIYMYGGMTAESHLDELLVFDIGNDNVLFHHADVTERREWRLLEVTGARPPPSFVATFAPIQNTGKILLFGGFASESADEGQTSVFIFNTQTNTWHWVSFHRNSADISSQSQRQTNCLLAEFKLERL